MVEKQAADETTLPLTCGVRLKKEKSEAVW